MQFRKLRSAWLFCLMLATTGSGAQGLGAQGVGTQGLGAQGLGAQGLDALQRYQAQAAGMFQGGGGWSGSDFGLANSGGPVRITNPVAPIMDGAGGVTLARPALAEAAPTEFQKFVLEATGKLLPIYGADFFLSAIGYTPLGFSPLQGAPVGADYPLGPGDEVVIRSWGSVDTDLRVVIDRSGLINVPKVGTVSLAGVRAAQAEEVIRAAFARVFRGFNLNVTMGRLRGMTVYVVGQARRPGTYTMSGLATVITALFESGGPSPTGSMRRVQVRRAGKQIAELDLYAFLSGGDKSADVRLLDGDVIVIPPTYGFVALTGKVETPAIYELRGSDDTLQSLLEVAGRLPVVADPRRIFLERVDPAKRLPRSVEEVALDTVGLAKPLRSGDLISVLPITPAFANAVTLRGSVSHALRVPYREGMRVTDLIPNKEFLVTRAVVRRQNSALVNQGRQEQAAEHKLFPYETELLEEAQRRAQPLRIEATDDKKREQVDKKVADEQKAKRAERQRETESIAQRRAREREEALLEQERRTFVESIGNQYDDINWDYAVVERRNRTDLTETLIPFNLGNALADPRGPDNVALQADDTVSVFSANDMRVPIAKRRVIVRVEGEIRRPGIYPVAPGETLVNIVEKAGGLTQDAYLFGAEFYRESVRKSQQENLDKFIRRLEQQSLSDAGRLAANASDPVAAAAIATRLTTEAEARNRFLQQLSTLRSSGRMALGLAPTDMNFVALPPFRLENGDHLVVPTRPDFVQVAGAVNTESALLWQPGRSVSDYLVLAGLTRDADKGSIFIVRTDGTITSNSSRWMSDVVGLAAMPGDVIVVPELLDKEGFWSAFTRNAKDVTQILYQLGLGAAAIKTLNR